MYFYFMCWVLFLSMYRCTMTEQYTVHVEAKSGRWTLWNCSYRQLRVTVWVNQTQVLWKILGFLTAEPLLSLNMCNYIYRVLFFSNYETVICLRS